MTALYAAGATPQMALFAEHCQLHGVEDPNFCGAARGSIILSAAQAALSWLHKKGILKPPAKTDFVPLQPPLPFNAIALVAPIGASFSEKELQRTAAAIALFRLGDDAELRHPRHAEYLHRALNEKSHWYKTFAGVHHYAFISPFPAQLLEEEHIPVAIDPEGFNRAAFIRDINSDIVAFFRRHL